MKIVDIFLIALIELFASGVRQSIIIIYLYSKPSKQWYGCVNDVDKSNYKVHI